MTISVIHSAYYRSWAVFYILSTIILCSPYKNLRGRNFGSISRGDSETHGEVQKRVPGHRVRKWRFCLSLLRFPQRSLPQRLCSEGELGTPVIWLLCVAKLGRSMAEEEKQRPAGTVSVGRPLSCPG